MGCCPNPFSLCLKRFLINLRRVPGNAARSASVQAVRRNLCAILALWAQTVQIADLPLHQDLLAKNILMTAQSDSCLGNSPCRSDPIKIRQESAAMAALGGKGNAIDLVE